MDVTPIRVPGHFDPVNEIRSAILSADPDSNACAIIDSVMDIDYARRTGSPNGPRDKADRPEV